MKKILTLILVLALALGVMVGCDKIPGLDQIQLPDFGLDLDNLFPGETPETPDTPDAPAVDADLEAAYKFVHESVKEFKYETGANYDVPAAAKIGEKLYNVVWTVSDERVTLVENGETALTVTVPSRTYEDIPYVLTFSITNEKGETLSRSYEHMVPQFKVLSFEEYMAAEQDKSVVVKGIVVAINAKSAGNTRNHLFLADENVVGGYYSYQMDQDPITDLGIEVGMTVLVTGPITPYSGMQEIKGGVAEIVSTEKKTVDFIDVTDVFASGESLKNYTALPVVIKGVTLGVQELGGTSDYLKFSLNGRESYIRSYKTDLPTTLPANAKETIEATHAANFGNIADVYGIVVLYNSNPYLIPLSVDCFTNIQTVEKTDEEKVSIELQNLTLTSKLTSDAVVELLATGKNYSDVTFAWACESEHAVLADGKLTVTVPDSKTTITVTVTATCGEATGTKTFEIELSKELTSIVDAIALGLAQENKTYTTGKYLVGGIILEVYNTQYGNMRLVDAYGNVFTIYGTYSVDGVNRYDAMAEKPVAGDYVVILGVVGQYDGTAQIKNGWIQSWTTPTTLKDAIDLGAAKDHNDFTGDKIVVTGTIKEVTKAEYGNMVIVDADGNELTIYGSYDSNGINGYKDMTYKPVAGDTITVYGVPGRYNDTKQIKNAWIVAVTKGENTPEDPTPEDPTPEDPTPEDPTPSEGNALTSDKVFASVPVEAAGSYPSYADYNGTYTIDGLTITTNNVLRNSHGIPYVFQFKKDGATFTISNVTVDSVTIVLVSSYDTPGWPTITLGGVELTYDTAAVLATKTATGTQNSSGYAVSAFTITITLDAPTTGDLVIKNGTTYAMYFKSFALGTSENTEPACKHENTTTTTVDATCTEAGSTTVVCNDCGETVSTETITALGHTLEQNTWYHPELVNATCVSTGVAVFECANCDYYETKVTEIDPEAHDFLSGEKETLTVANCATQTNGVVLAHCANEGCTATEEQEESYEWCHEMDVQKNVEPTCTEGGEYYAVCTLCGFEEAYSSEAGGHYNWYLTCGDTGNCMECGEEFTVEHNLAWNPATCTEAAYCMNCWSYVGDPLGHNYVDGVCTRCEEEDPNAHVCEMVATDNVVAPTCSATGYTVYACECGKTENRDEVAAVDHKDENGDYKCDFECDTKMLPAADSVLTVEQALALGALYTKNTYTTDKYYITGTITEVQNATYGNVMLQDETGSILIYGIYSADGKVRYDAMVGRPVVGETITVYGVVGFYDAAQMKSGWLTNHAVTHAHTANDATCTEDSVCSACGIVLATALGHNFVDGTCSACGKVEVSGEPQWVLVTDMSMLKEGDKVIIAAKTVNYAMSTTQNNNNRGATAITKDNSNGTVTFGTDVQQFTLKAGTSAGSFAFYTGSQYIYAASTSSNHLKSSTTLNDKASWNISVAADGTATIKCVNTSQRGTMQYNPNNGSPIFSCYSSASQQALVIYVLVNA